MLVLSDMPVRGSVTVSTSTTYRYRKGATCSHRLVA